PAASTPVVFKFDPSQSPIVWLGLVSRSPEIGPLQLRQIAEDQVQFRLERVPDVAAVTISGGLRRQILVEMDPVRAQALAVSERDIRSALAGANLVEAGGQVVEGTRHLGLRVLSQYRDVGEIARTIVTVRDGVPIYVADVARVSVGQEEPTSLVRVNGQPGVMIQVQRQSGANTVAVSDGILRAVRETAPTLRGAELLVLNDSARFIRSTLRSVQQAILIGGGLAVAVLLLFLRDVRSVLVIAAALPTSVVATFVLMFFAGYSLNLMTLGALAMGIGMLVDASIVVLENIFRHREMGKSGPEAATVGAQEVAAAILASTLTTVVVFLPVIFLRGSVITTQLFFQFSVVVVFALLCSLVVAVTLIPSLAAHLPRLVRREDAARMRPGGLLATYRQILTWSLRHRRPVFMASAVVFLLGLATFSLIGRETLPAADEGEFFVSVTMPIGTRLEVTDRVLARFEEVIRSAVPEAEYVSVTAGTTTFGGGSHRGFIRVRLVDRGSRSRSTEQIVAALRPRLQEPGARVFVRGSAGALGILRFGGGDADPIEVEIRGFDLRQGLSLAQQVRDLLERIPGVIDATVAREEALPEVVVRIDVERAAAFGVSPSQVASALRTAVEGEVATTLRAAGRETDIVVSQEAGRALTPTQVLSIPIISPSGRRVLLGQVAELVRGESPTQIFRRSRQRVITVTAGISGRDFGSVMADVRSALAGLPLPEGFSLALGQTYEEQQRSYRQLSMGFLVAVLLVFAVMAVQFEALLAPLLIMGSVPFALSGGLLMLFLTGTTLNIQSLIGLIVLAGVIVNNAILLIDFIMVRRRRDGMPLEAATVDGSVARLRPVLMTTVTTVMGLLPTAIGIGEGAELQVPLARAVIGGLLIGTMVTLVFIPTLYVSVEGYRARRKAPQTETAPVSAPAAVAGGQNGGNGADQIRA
ncbi:MAG: efflux RND transporter permease subunit, partial [Armatimonadota bacterium]|nr:efflux RND transporter permease subunit [Armatimonadota bacterium]